MLTAKEESDCQIDCDHTHLDTREVTIESKAVLFPHVHYANGFVLD